MANFMTFDEVQKGLEKESAINATSLAKLLGIQPGSSEYDALASRSSGGGGSVLYPEGRALLKSALNNKNIQKVQDLLKNGKIDVSTYYKVANEIARDQESTINNLTPAQKASMNKLFSLKTATTMDGSNRIVEGTGIKQLSDLNASLSNNFTTDNAGKFVATLPFSPKEYLSLPQEMLPKKEDADAGIVPISQIPQGRFRNPTPTAPAPTPQVSQPVQNPATAPNNGLQPILPPNQDPLANALAGQNPQQPTNNPLVLQQGPNQVTPPDAGPPPVAPTIDQQILNQQANQETENYLKALNQSTDIRNQALGGYGQALAAIEPQARASLAEILAQRQKGYDALKANLAEYEANQLGQATPGILEDLQTRGLLGSSGVGEALAREKAKLTANTANQLANYQIGNFDVETTGLSDIARQKAALQQALAGEGYGIAGDYADKALGTTQFGQELARAGIQRRFSLEDYQREAQLARELGAQVTPQVQPTSGSGLTTALAGAGTGAMIGGVPGAIVGGTAGLVLGSRGGGK